ncbi:hypothetical protein GJ496_009489 [Pomphorhynchus laevis]|nr:hypothetical protein GJ496_009489 [Pomphorhynchus laevis]
MAHENPCAKQNIRIVVLACDCFQTYSDQRNVKYKYNEVIQPFLRSVTEDAAHHEIHLIRFCVKVENSIKIARTSLTDSVINNPRWIKWHGQKIAYQAAFIQANLLAGTLAGRDEVLHKVLFVSILQRDRNVQQWFNIPPYLEHIYQHRLFYFDFNIEESYLGELVKYTGIPSKFITMLTSSRYTERYNNFHICEGQPFESKCTDPLSCANNLVCSPDQKCSCPHKNMISTVDNQFCRFQIYQPCNHKWSCQPNFNCEQKICRPKMPALVCPVNCTKLQGDCPKLMHCSSRHVCEYNEERIWFSWTYNKHVPDNNVLISVYKLQYYWLILIGTVLLVTCVGLPLFIWYRIRKNTIVPTEVVERLTQIRETITNRASKLTSFTRNTLSRMSLGRFSKTDDTRSLDELDFE